MIRALAITLCALLAFAAPAQAQSGSEAYSEFKAVIDGLNDNTFRKFLDAIDERAFINRVSGTRVLEADARQALAGSFNEAVEGVFTASFPRARGPGEQGEILGTIVAFEEENGQGRAIVRFESKGFRFTYHSYDLLFGRGGRVTIVDWYDYYHGSWFSEQIGDELVRAMPGKGPVAAILEAGNPTEAQLFQIGELLKTVRDSNWGRYFQIHEGLEDALRREPFVVRQHVRVCAEVLAMTAAMSAAASQDQSVQDQVEEDERIARAQMMQQGVVQASARLDAAFRELANRFPGDARHSLSLADHYVAQGLFAEAIAEYERFQEALGMKDGASESIKATAAMALGDFARAQEFARSATEEEPSLELSWWTLLRTRTAAGDFAGATEALTELEERFGHLLIPQKLRRDRFLRVLIDKPEYKEWRAQRDAA